MKRNVVLTLILLAMVSFASEKISAQSSEKYMRIAKIVVDSTQLESFKIALKEQMKAALMLEEGVLAYSAVEDKNNPSHITILETYASIEAYQAHREAPHFLVYKKKVECMVLSLELTEVMPIALGDKKQVLLY